MVDLEERLKIALEKITPDTRYIAHDAGGAEAGGDVINEAYVSMVEMLADCGPSFGIGIKLVRNEKR